MMFCPECGTKTEDGAAFCFNCGMSLRDISVSKTAAYSSLTPSDGTFEPLRAHTKTYVPEDVTVRKVEVSPVISASRFSLSSIPMFVITLIFTAITFILTLQGTDFHQTYVELLYFLGDVDNFFVDPDVSILVWLVLVSQSLVMCAGLWFTVITGLTAKGAGMNTAGLKMVSAISIISFVEFIICGFALLIFELDAGSKLPEGVVLITLVLYIMTIIGFAKLIGNIKNTIEGIAERRFCGDTSVFAIFMSFLISTVLFLFCFGTLGNRYFGSVSNWLMYLSAACILFIGIALIRHKTVMDNALKEAAERSLY